MLKSSIHAAGLLSIMIVCVSRAGGAARTDAPAVGKASIQAFKGRIVTDASGTVTADDAATLSVGPVPAGPCRFEAQVQLAERVKRGNDWRLMLTDPKDPKDIKAAMTAVILIRDVEGRELSFQLPTGEVIAFKYWPTEKQAKETKMAKDVKPPAVEKIKKSGIKERSWHGRWCSLLVDVGDDAVSLWFDGRFVGTVPLSAAFRHPMVVSSGKGDKIRNATLAPHTASG